ncbi:MAG: hypothetical protein MJ172_09030 [Clostridia bacterium]|nr:hypothetical protein [Clostridia bacterium]
MKRKLIVATLVAAMALGTCSCSSEEVKETGANETTAEKTEAAETKKDSEETEAPKDTEASEEEEVTEEPEETEAGIPDGPVNISGEELTLFYADESVEIYAGNIHRSSYNDWIMDLEVTNLDPDNMFFLQFNKCTLNGYFVSLYWQPGSVDPEETEEMSMYLGSADITEKPAEFTAEIELLYFDIDDRIIGDFTFVTDDYGYEEPDKSTEFPIVETEEASVYLMPEFKLSDDGEKFYLNLFCEKFIEYDDDHNYIDIKARNYSVNGSPYRNESANQGFYFGGPRGLFNPTGTTDMNKPANYNLDATAAVQTIEFDLEVGSNWHRDHFANVHVVLNVEGDTVSVASVTEIEAE